MLFLNKDSGNKKEACLKMASPQVTALLIKGDSFLEVGSAYQESLKDESGVFSSEALDKLNEMAVGHKRTSAICEVVSLLKTEKEAPGQDAIMGVKLCTALKNAMERCTGAN